MKLKIFMLLFSTKDRIINWIKSEYQSKFRDEFLVKEKIVNVKKGKRRYSLLFIHTPEQTIRLNIGRYA